MKQVKHDELRALNSKVTKFEIDKFVEDLLCEEKVVEKMIEMDKKSLDCEFCKILAKIAIAYYCYLVYSSRSIINIRLCSCVKRGHI